ncbi:hypothetical protein CRV24_009961 [Beauveria bassiana]|nr:hypothetical protein CRV24_009961 [Beauveria bassiana]KAH8708253.1 hypothetical protein HC256_010398 [Beauveria bassiana]
MHMHSTARPNANINSSLYGCGTNGGQMGVTADLSNPLYNAPEYKNSGAKPEGIIIKIGQSSNEENRKFTESVLVLFQTFS